MKIDPKTRRAFLVGSGRTLMALPFLPSIMPRAMAQSGPVIKKRFVMIHSGHCQAVEQWLPDPARFTFTERTNGREVALSSIPGTMSPVLGTHFDALRSKLIILSRMDPTTTMPNHNPEFLLTGGVLSESADSLDHVLAAKLYATAPLNLHVRSVFDQYNSGSFHVSVRNKSYVPGQFNPRAVFESIFGNGTPAATPRRQLLAVDRVLEEMRALKANRNLSSADRQRLDQHTELVFDVERKLNTPAVILPGCSNLTGPASSPVGSTNSASYQVVLDQMFDVLELSMKCGHTHVATLMMHIYDYFAGNVGFIPGIPNTVRVHEDIGHASEDPSHRPLKLLWSQFLSQRVARFLTNLNSVEDTNTGATFLDNSIVVWGNDQGALENTVAHNSQNIPLLIAGSAGGFLKTGKYVDYGPAYAANLRRPVGGDEGPYRRGRPYNQLLVTIARAMGLQPADYETNGVQGFGFYGPRTFSHDYLGGNHRRDLLPLIT
ncbi:MAG: DUF1552 domain-containing protein [Bdellovibrionaceae bacterium]|nr:DUF1552 domain-containing protein [Pseudobdellovibrionaceae bacterium]